MALYDAADTLIATLLCVTPVQSAPEFVRLARRAAQPFRLSLLISALRGTAQYIVLPFVLPLVGLATRPPIGVGIAFDAIALTSLIVSLRRLWQTRHPQRWKYLPLALLVAFAIAVFLLRDVYELALR